MWARISLALNCLAKVRPYVTAFFEGSEKSTGTRIFLIEIICASIAFFAHRLPSGNLHKETHRRAGNTQLVALLTTVSSFNSRCVTSGQSHAVQFTERPD